MREERRGGKTTACRGVFANDLFRGPPRFVDVPLSLRFAARRRGGTKHGTAQENAKAASEKSAMA
jgi:hypothetical protein